MTYVNNQLASYDRVDVLTFEGRHTTDPKDILKEFLYHRDFNEHHFTNKFNELGVACECEAELGIRCLLVFGIDTKIKPGSQLVLKYSSVALLSDCFERCKD